MSVMSAGSNLSCLTPKRKNFIIVGDFGLSVLSVSILVGSGPTIERLVARIFSPAATLDAAALAKIERVVLHEDRVEIFNVPSQGDEETLAPKPCAGIIEPRAPGELKPTPRNARTHGSKQVELLAAGISQFGFLVPVLID